MLRPPWAISPASSADETTPSCRPRLCEEALHDIPLLRRVAGFDAGSDALPDETTILNFRRLLQTHGLSSRLLVQLPNCRRSVNIRSGY